MQVDGKGKYANARYMLPSGTPSPSSWLTDRVEGNTHGTGRKLEPLHAASASSPWRLRDSFVAVRGVVGVLNMLCESSVGLMHPIIDVADSDVEVAQPLREVMITSS